MRHLLETMHSISKRMPDNIYTRFWKKEDCYLLSLYADAFATVELFCEGMQIAATTQCGMLLRLLLEQVSISKILADQPELIPVYTRHATFRKRINNLSKTKQCQKIIHEFDLDPKYPTPLQFLDYGWLGQRIETERNKENAMIKMAGFDDCLRWKRDVLDKLSHGAFTFADAATVDLETGSSLIQPFVDISCKLFDELCCSFHNRTHFDFVFDGASLFQDVFRPAYAQYVKKRDEEKQNRA